ncbi:MAG: hypothetical protein MZV63_15525 [Marinilabiliales bacterium]|nr:hypothetical protein [Marinilabiliales bacterium]
MDLDAMILGEYAKVDNLSKQLENYTNSVLAKHLDKPLRALDDVVDVFYKDFKGGQAQRLHAEDTRGQVILAV